MIAKTLRIIQIDYLNFSSNLLNGFNCILNAVYIFSNKYHADPANRMKVENTKKGMEKCLHKGMKITVCQSDNDTSFVGEFPDWCRERNIKQM